MEFPSWGPPVLAVMAALLLFMSLSRMAAKAIAEKAAVRGKRVVRVRRQWSRRIGKPNKFHPVCRYANAKRRCGFLRTNRNRIAHRQ